MKWNDIKASTKREVLREPPTNLDRWRAQLRGIDADYIPGMDDGEPPRSYEQLERERSNQ